MLSLTNPVGGKMPNTNRNEVRLVQQLLNKHRLPPLKKIAEDGYEGKETTAAITEFQQRVVKLTKPDGRVDPNGTTWRYLTTDEYYNLNASLGPFFPFAKIPAQSWMSSPRSFGSNRSNGTRAHAGCDLYFPKGTLVHAVADGKVTLGPYAFYCQTFALEIDHGAYLIRYGEIQAGALVKAGEKVKAGQPIGKVGHLVGIDVPSDMLHLEMYSNHQKGPLTVKGDKSKKRSDGISFQRRSDLMDPTSYLNAWKLNLPPSA